MSDYLDNPVRIGNRWYFGNGKFLPVVAGGEGPVDAPTNNQYRSLQELDDRMRSIRGELAILDGLQDPTEEDFNYQGTLIQEHDDLDAKAQPLRKRMEDLKRVQAAGRHPENREEPATRGGITPGQPPAQFVRSGRDPFEDLDRVRHNLVSSEDLRVRAADVIEMDVKRYEMPQEMAETAARRAQGHPGIAKHILLTGTKEYRDAFRHYIEHEGDESRFRAINLTAASGGFLLPYILDPTIVLTNNASANPFRRISRVVQTTSNAWQGVNSAGVTAQFIAEATTAADMSPTVGQIQIVPEKAAAWVLGSYEALDDTNFGEQLPGLLSDARDRIESAYFTTGAGSGSGVPLGVLAALGTGNRVAPGATGTAFNGTASISDVYNLQAALPPRFRNAPGAAFLGNIKVLNAVRAIDVYGGGSFWANLTSNTPPSLVGQPIYEGSDMPSLLTGTSALTGTGSATLAFGDFGQFIIADRVGVSMLYEPMVKGSTNAQLPSGQAGWYMFWRTASAVSTTAAFRYLTIS